MKIVVILILYNAINIQVFLLEKWLPLSQNIIHYRFPPEQLARILSTLSRAYISLILTDLSYQKYQLFLSNLELQQIVLFFLKPSSSTRVYSKEPDTLLSEFRDQALAYINRKKEVNAHGMNGHDVTWHWSRDGCRYVTGTTRYATCECYRTGVYAVTTDMYDVNVSDKFDELFAQKRDLKFFFNVPALQSSVSPFSHW